MSDNLKTANFACLKSIKQIDCRFYSEILKIRKYSPVYGAALIEWLAENNVQLTFDDTLKTYGECHYQQGQPINIVINPKYPNRYNEAVLHEGFHAVQFSSDEYHYVYSKSFSDVALDFFSMEAGAISFAMMAQYEMLLNKSYKSFHMRIDDTAPHLKYLNQLYKRFAKDFQNSKLSGFDNNRALKAAGKKAFMSVFNNQKLTNDYITNTYLTGFIENMQKYSHFSGYYYQGKVDPLLAGLLKDGDSLSAKFNKEASFKQCCNIFPDLEHVLNWMEYIRVTQFNGKHHFTIPLKAKEVMDNTHNPYRNVGYDDFETAYLENLEKPIAERDTVIDLMNRLSGHDKMNQLHLDFSRPFQSFS